MSVTLPKHLKASKEDGAFVRLSNYLQPYSLVENIFRHQKDHVVVGCGEADRLNLI